MRKGIIYSVGTSEENQAAAAAEDAFVFPVLVPTPDEYTTRYADPIPRRAPPELTHQWAYPADEASEPVLLAAARGPVVDLPDEDWMPGPPPPPPMPE